MAVLHIPSHGVSNNGLIYQPSGAGPHPTLIVCHGLPGNEKNLDLAQAVRRAGWNAVTFSARNKPAVARAMNAIGRVYSTRVLASLVVPKISKCGSTGFGSVSSIVPPKVWRAQDNE